MNTWPNRGASGGPCGGWNNESLNSQTKSDHVGLTQANRPPRKSVRFIFDPHGIYETINSGATFRLRLANFCHQELVLQFHGIRDGRSCRAINKVKRCSAIRHLIPVKRRRVKCQQRIACATHRLKAPSSCPAANFQQVASTFGRQALTRKHRGRNLQQDPTKCRTGGHGNSPPATVTTLRARTSATVQLRYQSFQFRPNTFIRFHGLLHIGNDARKLGRSLELTAQFMHQHPFDENSDRGLPSRRVVWRDHVHAADDLRAQPLRRDFGLGQFPRSA